MAEPADVDRLVEPWLHRAVLRAGLGLTEQRESSQSDEEDIVEQIVSFYLTSPYDSLRRACVPVLQAWKDTAVAKRAVQFNLSLLEALSITMDSADAAPPTTTRSPLQERFHLYYRHLTQENHSSLRLLHLQIVLILHHLDGQAAASDLGPSLVAALSDPSSTVRQVAATTAGQVGLDQPEIIDGLLHLLIDAVPQVRQAAVEALGQMGMAQQKAITALLDLLNGPDSHMGVFAVTALAQAGKDQPEILGTLTALLDNPAASEQQRAAAAQALGDVRIVQPTVIESLLHALTGSLEGDPLGRVHQAATRALGQLGSVQPEILETLIRISHTNFYPHDYPVRRSAAEALAQLSVAHPEILAGLLQSFTTSASHVRHTVTAALAEAGVVDTAERQGPPARAAARSSSQEAADVGQERLDALLRSLTDPAPGPRQTAFSTLEQLGKSHPGVAEHLRTLLSDLPALLQLQRRSADEQQRIIDKGLLMRQIAFFQQIGATQPEALAALVHALTHTDPEVRARAAAVLGALDVARPPVLGSLLHACTDPVLDVSRAAALALVQLGTTRPEVREALLAALPDTAEQVRWAVELALQKGHTVEPVAAEDVLIALNDPSPSVRAAAARAIGEGGVTGPEVRDALLRALNASGWDTGQVRQAAARALGKLRPVQPELLTTLLHTLTDAQRHQVRAAAAMALGEIGTAAPEVTEGLRHALNDAASDVRAAAVTALGQLGVTQPELLITLLHALIDPASTLRVAAAQALGRLGVAQPDILSALLDALTDPDPSGHLRAVAATALGELGVAQPGILDGLLHTLTDPDKQVRQAASHSLTSLPIDRFAVSQRLVEKLSRYDLISHQQLTADEVVDELLATLQQVARAV